MTEEKQSPSSHVVGWEAEEKLTVEEAWTILCETPDITSPEEYPDHALITMEQLGSFMARAVSNTKLAVVKPLDWQGCEARSVVGSYRVQRLDDKWVTLLDGYYMVPKIAGVSAAFDTADEAKSYAQADCEARILSALSAPETERS